MSTQANSGTNDSDKLTTFDYVLLIIIAFTYPFVAWCLITKADIIAYTLPIIIFIVAAVVTYTALRDFLKYYKEASSATRK